MTLVKMNNRPTRTIDHFIDSWFNGFPNLANEVVAQSPATNVYETKDAYLLEMLVPGRAKEDFKVVIDQGMLTVSYEKKESAQKEEKNAIRREFSFQAFKRSFSLDDSVNIEAIEAEYENGLLKLTLPKKEESKPEIREIQIR